MRRLAETDGLTQTQRDILAALREFVDAEIIPVANELDHSDTYPDQIVSGLRELGVFGLMIEERYGGLGESLLTYALVAEEIAPRLDEHLRHHQHALHRRRVPADRVLGERPGQGFYQMMDGVEVGRVNGD
jgi:alkylation response protein AidB-like acyl-CoA dehydrogenase